MDNNQTFHEVETPLTVNEAIVKSSIQLVTIDPNTQTPYGWGSGFIVYYKDRFFAVTVLHVIEDDPEQIYFQAGIGEDQRAIIKQVGPFRYFKYGKFKKDTTPEELIAKIEAPDDLLDIAFAEVKLPLYLRQQAIDFGHFQIVEGDKIIINMQAAIEPNTTDTYGFFGHVLQKPRGKVVFSTPAFKYGLRYHRTHGHFHIFLTPEPSIDPDQYRGCSGAPLIDENGLLAAVVCKVWGKTRMVYAFPITELRRLIDMTLMADEATDSVKE